MSGRPLSTIEVIAFSSLVALMVITILAKMQMAECQTEHNVARCYFKVVPMLPKSGERNDT